ncbi:MAG TPA: hypothetical protein VFM73_00720 [Xanthomonadaceae bacterium]|nr:hypothetical protein [Xanthomonadaceae bacterium]
MKRFVATVVCVVALAAGGAVHAQDRAAAEWWGNVNVGSHHFGDEDEYLAEGESFNEFNPGMGLEVQWQPMHAVSVGYFRNSVDENSVYALYHFTPLALGDHVRVGGMVGVVSGYPGYHGGDAAPAGGLVAKIERGRWGANLILLPPLEDVTPATIGLQLKYRFR